MVAFTLIVLLLTMVFKSFAVVRGEPENIGFNIQMTFTYSNLGNGTRIWNFTEEDRRINLFMNNTWQTVWLINHSLPLETLKVDEDGNPVAVLRFSKSELRPGENLSYTTTYFAVSKPRSIAKITEEKSETLDGIPKDLKEKYCKGGGSWLVDDPQLRELAYKVAKNETKVLTIIRRFILWITDNIGYEFYETYLYPNETYKERKGACLDQAILFITLCRIYGIPAFLQIGCIYMPMRIPPKVETDWGGHRTSVLKRIGWHAWGMAYVPPWGWLPVDLTYVMGGVGDSLDAIRIGAVTSQETILLVNVTRTDYIASSRMARQFLEENGFYIYMRDEMDQIELEDPRSLREEIIDTWPYWVLAAVITVALAWSFVHLRKGKWKLRAT